MAQVDYFLKIDGIEGESQDAANKNEIQLTSWSWGETNAGTSGQGGGAGAGKVNMQDFNFEMPISKASPKLLLACAEGTHIKSAILTCRRAGKGQLPYLVIKFTDVLISSFHTGGQMGAELLPTDQISFNYTKIEYGYKPQKADGSLEGEIKVGYDLKKNQKV